MIDFPHRTEHRDPGNARVTARDVLLLQLVAQAQPVTGSHIAEFLGMSEEMVRRRVRALHAMKLLEKHVTAAHEPNRITLAPAACPILARALGRSPEEFHCLRGLSKTNFIHHDGAVRMHVLLAVACARSNSFRLHEFLHEREIRALLGSNATHALIPDAIAVLEHESGTRRALCIEVDTASENPSWFATHKAAVFARHREHGVSVRGCRDFVVLVTTPSERRRNRLAAASWEQPVIPVPEGLLYFADHASLDSRNVLRPDAWWTPRVIDGTPHLVQESPVATVAAEGCGDRNGSHEQEAIDFNTLDSLQTGSFTSAGTQS